MESTMQASDLASIDPNINYNDILPIQQKRTIAFINHFVMNTVSFLNTFAQSCESRLMEFEDKLQKVESSLLILEAQLSSVAGLEETPEAQITTEKTNNETVQLDLPQIEETIEAEATEDQTTSGPAASKDPRFEKFFKMLQFGVPPQAVKLKMQLEGVDPNILDNPSATIPE